MKAILLLIVLILFPTLLQADFKKTNPPTTSSTDAGTGTAVLYSTNAGQAMSDATANRVNFEDVVFDECNPDCVTVGASWVYTVPTGGGGVYQVCAQLVYAANNNWTLADEIDLRLYKNAASLVLLLDSWQSPVTANGIIARGNGCSLVKLVATDTIYVSSYNAGGGAAALNTSGSSNWISIVRVSL